jgi:ribosomal protein S3AE
MSKIKRIEREILRIKTEIVMGDYNGWSMTEDYKKKLIKLEQELFNLLTQ